MTTSDPPKTPSEPPPGSHALRRVGGARVNVSKRVKLTPVGSALEHDGWLLNVSRGGVRLILEETLAVDDRVTVEVGDADDPEGFKRPARVVWVRQEPDGIIAGLEFLDARPISGHPTSADSIGSAHSPSSAAHPPAPGQGAGSTPPPPPDPDEPRRPGGT